MSKGNSKYRKIDPRIWNDSKFMSMSDNAKLVFFFLLTHPHMTSLGAMRGSLAGLAEELGWSSEAFRKAFQEGLSKGMVKHDQKACLIALPNFIRYNPPENPNVLIAWSKSVDLLPECELKNYVLQSVKDFAKGLSEAFQVAFDKSMPKTMPNQEQEQEQEQEPKNTMSGNPDEDAKTDRRDESPPPNPPMQRRKTDPHEPNELASQAIDYLNQKTGRRYEAVEANLKLVRARLREGHTLSIIRQVVDHKCEQWSKDPKMREYLRPSTLFNAEKFNQYVGQLGQLGQPSESDELDRIFKMGAYAPTQAVYDAEYWEVGRG